MFPAPAHLFLLPGMAGAPDDVDQVQLIIDGQGTVVIPAGRPPADEFSVTFGHPDEPQQPGVRWRIGRDAVTLSVRSGGEWTVAEEITEAAAALDPDPACQYWFSLDSLHRRLRYGKGEMRLATCLVTYDFPPDVGQSGQETSWLTTVDAVHFDPPVGASIGGPGRPIRIDVWRDAVVVEPSMKVLARDQITMLDMAHGTATVVENLTDECQTLYANIAGAQFGLDAPDFREFSRAIQASIDSYDGWCHKRLKDKAKEFGDEPEPLKTYLRITMGSNQGESPGIPFVMEIWPHGHFSPIHNHGGANAMIRVLHGEICVSLYAMLSANHVEPIARMSFVKDDVTWITPRLNQNHMLMNEKPDACVTIQCYMYPETDRTHYPYFDYINKAGTIKQFPPDSDMDFLAFKELMRKEWDARLTYTYDVAKAGTYVRDTAADIDVLSVEERIGLAAHRGLG
jgi:hypothetical protein